MTKQEGFTPTLSPRFRKDSFSLSGIWAFSPLKAIPCPSEAYLIAVLQSQEVGSWDIHNPYVDKYTSLLPQSQTRDWSRTIASQGPLSVVTLLLKSGRFRVETPQGAFQFLSPCQQPPQRLSLPQRGLLSHRPLASSACLINNL